MKSLGPLLLAGVLLPSLAGGFSHAEALSVDAAVHSEEPQLELKNTGRSVRQYSNFYDAADKTRYHERQLRLHLRDNTEDHQAVNSNFAYAVVLVGNDDRDIRVLGQSLIESQTDADFVAILGPKVTHETETRARTQGWRIRRTYTQDFPSKAGTAPDERDVTSESVRDTRVVQIAITPSTTNQIKVVVHRRRNPKATAEFALKDRQKAFLLYTIGNESQNRSDENRLPLPTWKPRVLEPLVMWVVVAAGKQL